MEGVDLSLVILAPDELRKALLSPRPDLIIAGKTFPERQAIILVRQDLNYACISFSHLITIGVNPVDCQDLGILDCGQTVSLGKYEIDSALVCHSSSDQRFSLYDEYLLILSELDKARQKA